MKYRLFLYLQPSAFAFIEDSPNFAEHYFASMHALDTLIKEHKIQRQGQALFYFIKDFSQLITDWEGDPRSVYKTVYAECRHFVLPMNPQRIELEYAVKSFLRTGGLDIRLTAATKTKEAPPSRRQRGTRQSGSSKQGGRYAGKRRKTTALDGSSPAAAGSAAETKKENHHN